MIFVFALFLQVWRELEFEVPKTGEAESLLPPVSVALAVLVAIGLIVMLRKSRRNYMALPEVPVSSEPADGDVTVIIPARNEERTIERCVKSFQGHRVLVVDDQSNDHTAQRAAAAGAEVVQAPKLLKGQLGKPNACQTGAKAAETRYLLFADADTYYDPRFVGSMVRYADENQFFLVSPFLKQECVTLFEKMLLPYAFGLYFTGVNAANLQNFLHPETLANGQSMLFLRQPYEFIGGHNSVINSVIEDVALAARVKRHRMKLQIVRAEHLGAVRMYDSLGAIWRGFRKNSFKFLQANRRTGLQVMFTSILLTSVLPLMVWLWIDRQQWMIVLLALLVPYLFAPWYGGVFRSILSLPAIYVFQLIALDGMAATTFGRKTDWKGRKV